MANTAIEIPFYVSEDGEPLTGAAAQMDFESLKTLAGTDKSGSASEENPHVRINNSG